jgi:hypothetical protein
MTSKKAGHIASIKLEVRLDYGSKASSSLINLLLPHLPSKSPINTPSLRQS